MAMMYPIYKSESESYKAFIDANCAGGRWIPVSEQLPNAGDTVLVYDTSNPDGLKEEIALISNYGRACLAGEEYSETWRGVTHWMPLPAAPGVE